MVLDNQSNKPVEKTLALRCSEAVYCLAMMPDSIQTLPSRHGVSPYNGVDSFQASSNVLGSTPRPGMQFVIVLLGAILKNRLSISGSQALEKLLIRFRNTIINFISRSPERIWRYLSVQNTYISRLWMSNLLQFLEVLLVAG